MIDKYTNCPDCGTLNSVPDETKQRLMYKSEGLMEVDADEHIEGDKEKDIIQCYNYELPTICGFPGSFSIK